MTVVTILIINRSSYWSLHIIIIIISSKRSNWHRVKTTDSDVIVSVSVRSNMMVAPCRHSNHESMSRVVHHVKQYFEKARLSEKNISVKKPEGQHGMQ